MIWKPLLRSTRCSLAKLSVAALCVVLLAASDDPGAGPVASERRHPNKPAAVDRVRPNDNRMSAGRRRRDTLRIQLVARLGEWHPNGEREPGVTIPTFAEEGGAPSVPGPLVRVPEGTTVAITLRNALPQDTLRVKGLHPRPLPSPADSAALILAPGDRRTVTFRLDAAGTFYYWGTTTRRTVDFRTGLDAQLTGAIVVDPPSEHEPGPKDRIFVLGMWTDTVARSFLPRHRVLGVVNGRSWPNTEALSATVGDTVRWRVINASGDLHPMHLHGFYFRVTSRGDGTRDTLFAGDRAQSQVTEAMTMGATYAMTWIPERAGNWLYHCHIPEHFGPRGPLGLPPDTGAVNGGHDAARPAGPASLAHAKSGMSGLVLGVTVRERPGLRVASTSPDSARDAGRRQIRLLVRATVGSTLDTPLYRYAIHEGGAEPVLDTGRVASPPLVVVRGEPLRITVVNRLPEPTAVHWHGIELESVYDGVPGFSGAGRRLTPLIAPGDSFVVRFTPPRAGTFIYHTHHDEDRQQVAGLAGALIVRDSGQAYDPSRDMPIAISSPLDQSDASRRVFFNASATPAPLVVRAGELVRLRFINMTVRRSGIRVRLRRGEAVLPWRLLAKDGAEVPASLGAARAVPVLLSIGETYDLGFEADEPGDLQLEIRVGPLPDARVLGVQPVRVVAR